MKAISKLCGVVILALVVASCGRDRANEAGQNDAVAPVLAEPTGTTGDQSSGADPVDVPRGDALPATASPVPLVGGAGAILLVSGVLLRRYGRRS